MNDIKPWYLSRTIWASLVTILASAAGLAGLAVNAAEQAQATETILQLVTAVSGLVAIFGRLAARSVVR